MATWKVAPICMPPLARPTAAEELEDDESVAMRVGARCHHVVASGFFTRPLASCAVTHTRGRPIIITIHHVPTITYILLDTRALAHSWHLDTF